MSNGEKLALLVSHLFIIGWLVFLGLSIHELLKPKKKKEVIRRKKNESLKKPLYGSVVIDERIFENPNQLSLEDLFNEQNKKDL